MTDVVLQFIALSLMSSLILGILPTRALHIGIIATGGGAIALIAPVSLAWILALTGLIWLVMHKLPDHPVIFACALGAPALSLLLLREQNWLTALGAAYFCLRAMHVVLDWWMGRLRAPDIKVLLSYMLFVPVFLAGPIHRFQNFDRQISRRRMTSEAVFSGMERILIGVFMIVVLGGAATFAAERQFETLSDFLGEFGLAWATSALGWVQLYFVFAGLSSVAVGSAKTIGLTIEENFNHPYRALTLVDFWSRWHMSLTLWCRDYVFQPIAVSLRSSALGVFAAMLVLGVWHESSVYYVLWSLWQAGGIVLSQLLRPWTKKTPKGLDIVISPFMILGWLSLAKPVVTHVLEVMT